MKPTALDYGLFILVAAAFGYYLGRWPGVMLGVPVGALVVFVSRIWYRRR